MKDGWIVKKFSDVFDLQMGKTPSRDNVEYWGDGNSWVAISDIKGKYISETKESITNKAVVESKIKKVKAGTVIMSFKLTVGRTAIAKKDLYTNEAIMAFNLKSNYEVLPEYTYYYLKAYKWEGGNKAVMGITLNKASISTNKFIIPPLPEQSRIVEELDQLSNIIEKKREQLSELDNLAQSIFYDMFGDPVVNDKGWEVKKLGEVCKTTSGGTPSKSHSEYYEGGSIPWLRSGEVNNMYILNAELCITEEGLANSSAKWFPQNTVVIAMYGATVGQVGILCRMMTTNQAICGIFPNESFTPIFLYHFLLSKKEEYIKLASGGAQPNISQNIIRETLVCCPDLVLQQLFAQKIEAIESEKALIKQSIAETEELFNSRMDFYFG